MPFNTSSISDSLRINDNSFRNDSKSIVLENLNAKNIGKLLSYYEAKIIFEGLILDINPFDQFGVQLGKENANNLRKHILEKNKNPGYTFQECNDASKHYLEMLFSKKILWN